MISFVISQPATEEEYKQYYQLRWKRLRAPWQQLEGSEKDDIEDTCFHVMATTTNNIVIGVARLQFNSKIEAQIRYMAVAEKFEGKGVGRELINAIEQHAKKTLYRKIILDARETAVGFYQKMGYELTEKSYLLFDSIQHYRMLKKL